MREPFKCIEDDGANVLAVKSNEDDGANVLAERSKRKTPLTIFTDLIKKQSEYEYNEGYPKVKNLGREVKERSPSPLKPKI